jgi:hypothetical protein
VHILNEPGMAQYLVMQPKSFPVAPLYYAPSGMHACDFRVLVPLAAHDREFGGLAMCTSETMMQKSLKIHEATAQEA